MPLLRAKGRVLIRIEKRLPVQGGLGGASANAVSALLGLERVLKKRLSAAERLRMVAEVGADLPLFLLGGTVLGVGRGEQVYSLPDLPAMACVVALPEIAVSTPKAFGEWDRLAEQGSAWMGEGTRLHMDSGASQLVRESKLTASAHSDRMLKFSREISAWLGAAPKESRRRSGVSASGGGRAENPLLDLVRTGIENDFEKVVFPQYPELLKVKRVLDRAGAQYASLSGSGSAIYGLFDSSQKAAEAAKKLERSGTRSVVTSTLTRRQYWRRLRAASS
jgi:4-diphosphocytidyl-2-C-methyl-D-erythritol kinase